ncbi:MAG: ABC transporter permease [Acidimicrobiia bacterium]|nr:ABC transporter permease [Acidimicrobiia bacterium]
MRTRYVVADLIRNPRRTLSAMVGVTLGVGLFCGVLFFVDGLSASMTQRAVAPLPIDMQRITTDRVGGELTLTEEVSRAAADQAGSRREVRLEIRNDAAVTAHEVTVRSAPTSGWNYEAGSARIDDVAAGDGTENPFASGPGKTGYNLGNLEPGASRVARYEVVSDSSPGADPVVESSFSTREAVTPVPANQPPPVAPAQLAEQIAGINGVARVGVLDSADLGAKALSAGGSTAPGPAKIFGFDASYADNDPTIDLVDGKVSSHGAVISSEASQALGIVIGDTVTVQLPDGSDTDFEVSGVADLSRARSLFASRRGGDLENFVYTRHSVVVTPDVFAATVLPAYERAAVDLGGRLKNVPVREVDIWVDRSPLDADPSTANAQTQRIAEDVTAQAAHQDFLLDNISNTLTVAADDASAAKSLFVFLGVPGALLAALLAAYAGSVLAEAQRREQATLRIRGASRRDLLRMLTLRTALLTLAGSIVGLGLGFLAATAALGLDSLQRAGLPRLLTSAALGTAGGLVATGAALYLTGRRSIDREIHEDRARYATRAPLWRRAGLDIVAIVVLVVGTILAVRADAFAGEAGSVYFGRAVHLKLSLLVLPIAVWVAGTLFGARLFGALLARTHRHATVGTSKPLISLYRLGVGRRPWAIGNAVVAVSLIVALAVSLTAFTASYDAAKVEDARYATGSDIRITPGPSAGHEYTVEDASLFRTPGVADVAPVIYGVRNVILKSARTSDPANLAAVDLEAYAAVAPLEDQHFVTSTASEAIEILRADPTAVFLSADMADFLRAGVGDGLQVLLARGTDQQTTIDVTVAGLFERLPGFPDGASALMSIDEHSRQIPSMGPDFYLASATSGNDAGLQAATGSLEAGPVAADSFQIDTRETMLARDQSSLAALNIGGLVDLDAAFALSMAVVAIAIFVFGLLLQRRREYVTLRAQGLEPRTIRVLIGAEAGTAAVGGAVLGVLVGAAMGFYFVTVLQPLFVLSPAYVLPAGAALVPVGIVLVATAVTAVMASALVNRLDPTELLRDE